MKKISTLICVIVSFIALNAQFLQYQTTKTKWFELNSTESIDCKLKFTNKVGSGLVINYKKIEENINPAWGFTLCDNINCAAGLPDNGTYLELANNELTEMKISVETKAVKDTAKVAYELTNASNPSIKDTITFYMFLRWGLNTKLTNMEILTVYPNPTLDVLHINTTEEPVVEITNMLGSVVLNSKLSVSKTVNVGILPKGVYFAKIATTNGFAVAKFLKN